VLNKKNWRYWSETAYVNF